MALPEDLATAVCTGTFLDPTGMPLRGTVSFVPNATLADPGDSVVIAQIPRTYDLSDGSFAATLLGTDASQIVPQGWAYVITVCLANSQPYSFTAYLPSADSPLDISELTPLQPVTQMGSYLLTSGGAMTGPLFADGSPTSANQVATMAYVESQVAGLQAKPPVQEATAAALIYGPATYSGGVLSPLTVGALVVDGVTVALGDRVLVKNESPAQANNGIYTCTATGSVSTPWQLTRSADMDTGSQVPGAYAFVEHGSDNEGFGFIVAGTGPYTLGATAIVWEQFTSAGDLTAGTGLTVSGGVVSLNTPVTIADGGTFATSASGALANLGGIASSLIGADSGVAGLNSSGVVPVAQGGTGSSSQNWQGLLTPTTQTGTYTASAGQLVKANISSASWTLSLPDAPAANTVVGAKVIANATGNTNTLTVACQGSDHFEQSGGATSTTLYLLSQAAAWQYNGGYWTRLSDDLPLGQLETVLVPLVNSSPSTAAGALFNGSANDGTALNNATQNNAAVMLAAGVALTGVTVQVKQSGVHIQGSGMYSTTIRDSAGLAGLLSPAYGNSFVYNVEISDLTLDGNNLSTYGMLAFGTLIGRLTLRRVRFINFPGYIIDSGDTANFVFEDCIVDGAGNSKGSFFVGTTGPFESLLVRRCKFRYLQAGIQIADWHAAYVEIDDCDFDMGWWLTKSIFANSGATVTYTSNGLADSSASFSGLTAGQIVRVLPVRGTGTFTSASAGTLMADTSATFQTGGVLRGEIVRTATAFGVVSKVLSQTELHVEEWLSQSTYQPVQPPALSSAYTVYQVLLGAITASTGTTITIEHGAGQGGNGGWYGFSGTEVTPAAHTLYEVLTAPPGYGLWLDSTVEKAVVTNNRFRRGWCDNVELFGQRLIVTNNIAEDDMGEGIVIQGASGDDLSDGNIVANNLSRHNGASGLYLESVKNSQVLGNVCEDNGWGCPAVSKVPQIAFWGSTDTSFTGNSAVNTGEFVPAYGIWLSSSTGCTIQGLTATGASTADIRIDDENAAAANQILDCTYGTLAYDVATNGQFLRLAGAGAPALAASPGSLWSQTDTGGLWLKESGDGTTGWVAIGGGTGTAIGGQGAYAGITATVTEDVTATTWTAVAGAPSITVPNDGNTYRLSLTLPYIELSGAAQLIIGIGTSTSAILSYSQVNVGAASVPLQIRVDLQKITGSGQVVGVYAYCYSSLTVSLEAYSNAPCELAAYRVA
jgi:hypothetical protein